MIAIYHEIIIQSESTVWEKYLISHEKCVSVVNSEYLLIVMKTV